MDTAAIRRFDPAEAESYVALLRELDAETPFLMWEAGERPITIAAVIEQARLSDPSRRLHLVADRDGELVGFLVARRGGSRRVEHRCDFTMAVRAGHRGQGAGGRLLALMERWAIDSGIVRIELTVMAHNDAARRLYERAGFALEGVKRAAIVVDGSPVDELIMGKLLGGAVTDQSGSTVTTVA